MSTETLTRAAAMVNGLKLYGKGDTEVRALDDVTVDFERGRMTAIMGASGSGKSTLMHCLAGLDNLTSGEVWLGDIELSGLNERQRTRARRDKVGFVFQAFNLLPTLTAREKHPTAATARRPSPRQGLVRVRGRALPARESITSPAI